MDKEPAEILRTALGRFDPKKKTKKCPVCNITFQINRPWQEYCSPKCRYSAYNEKHPRGK